MVATAAATLNMDATFLSQDPDPVEPGEYVDLRWRIENTGSEDLVNAYVRVDLPYPFSIDDPKESQKNIGTLSAIQEGEKSSIVKFRVRVDENAVEGTEEIKFYYSSRDLAGEILDEVDINIQSRQVVFGIKSIQITPENPAPGETAQVNITLQNLNDPTLQNIRVKLDLKDTEVATLGSIDEKIIKRLAGNTDLTVPFTLFIGAEAASKVHQIPLKLSYSDKFGRQAGIDTYFGLKVEAPPEYLVNLEESNIYIAGKPGSVTLSISNIGAGNLNYVAMEILPSEDYELLSSNMIYLGNLESDDFETGEFEIFIPNYKSSIPLQTKISFKDSFNQPMEEVVEIPIRIYTKSQAISLGLEKGRNPWVIIILLIAGGVGVYYYQKKRKSK